MVGGGGGLVTKSCPTLATPWTVACQAPIRGILQANILQWVPSLGDLPNPGIKPGVGCHLLLQGIFLTQEPNPALQADSLPTEL